jgi:hypothetical protein
MKHALMRLGFLANCAFGTFGGDVQISDATAPVWERHFDGSSQDVGSTATILPNGDIALVGLSYRGTGKDKTGIGFGDADGWVILADSAGQKKWDTVVGGEGYDHLTDVKGLPDGRLICVGYSNSEVGLGKSAPHLYGQDYWVVCLAPDGKRLWDRTFDAGWAEYATGVAIVENQTIVVAGQSDVGGRLIYVDLDGNLIAARVFQNVERISAVTVDRNGKVYACGYTGPRTGKDNLWAAKLGEPGGQPEWTFVHNHQHGARGFWLSALRDGGVLAVGNSSDGAGNGVGVLMKLDTLGNLMWRTSMKFDPKNTSMGGCYELDSGGFLIGGTTGLDGYHEQFMARLDSNGGTLWIHRYPQNYRVQVSSVHQCGDGGFLSCGYWSGAGSDWDFRISKLAPEATALQLDPPAVSSSPRLGSHLAPDGFHFSVIGKTGRSYVTERTTDLSNWRAFSTNTVTSGDVKVVDPEANGHLQTQYRVREVGP